MSDLLDTYHPSFPDEFLSKLEHQLSAAFASGDDKDITLLWCDGVLPPPDGPGIRSETAKKHSISTRAFIGKDGHGEYTLTLFFGKHSLRRYIKGSSVADCLPSLDDEGWIRIDPEGKTVDVYLK